MITYDEKEKAMKSTNDQIKHSTTTAGKPLVGHTLFGGHSYFAKHLPTGEDWYILGIDEKGDRVCVAGWPATIGKLSDCENLEVNKPLTEEEKGYRDREFGQNWL